LADGCALVRNRRVDPREPEVNPDQVKAELDKRGLTARVDTGGRGDIHTASYKSYHTTTPNGYDLQISATTRANRGA